MTTKASTIGKALYGVLFVVLVPFILLKWDEALQGVIKIPVPGSATYGWILLSIGSLLLLSAMIYLFVFGKGLPMNAYPPKFLVNKGPYYLMKHPIYIGFAMILLGYFIYTDSSPGFWLIAPLTILGMIALVLGYEVIDIKSRFPDQRVRVLIDIPYSRDSRIRFEHRIGSLILVLGSLLLVNFLTGHVREYVDTIVIDEVGFKSLWPELDWVWLGVAFIVFTVLFIKTFNGLRNWTIKAIIAIGLITFLRLIWPEVTTLSLIESPYTYLTAPLSVMIISLTTLWNNANWKRALCLGFFLISVYSQLQQTHSITIYLAIGLMVYLLSEFYLPIWAFLRRLSQRIANSWKEWTFGNIRIINHGFYVGFGALAGILLAGSLVGGDQVWGVLIFSIVVIVFSAIWAQLIEGSEKLKRPYGYYGALVGIIFASGLVWLLEYDVWLLIASISVCMPWVQAIGRLRCLINGCCHGSPTDNEDLGIRYFHFRSRVCGLSELKGELLHPTQLYAIIWLFLVGLLMLKFWNDQFVPSFIFGMYLILTGLGRFVEEAYRGEVQTKIIRGLRLYQWTAILSVIIGIVMTCIPQRFDYVIYDLSLDIVWAALIGGFFTFFAMGVDFPNSNKRFSRLV